MVLTTTKQPPDYSTFSGGQAVCPLLEVTGVTDYLVFLFTPLQHSPLFCAINNSCYAVYFALSLLTPCPTAFPLLLGPILVGHWFSLSSPWSSTAPFILPLLYLSSANPVTSCVIIRSVAVLISVPRAAKCNVLKAWSVYHYWAMSVHLVLHSQPGIIINLKGKISPGQVSQLVGTLSHAAKVFRFDSQLQVQYLGCTFNLWSRCMQVATDTCFPLTFWYMFLSPSFSL